MLNDGVLDLSMVQQDIYFDQLHFPNSPVYNIGGYIDLPRIDVARLTQAHQHLVQQHDAFGLRIVTHEGGVGQTVSSHRTLALPIIDFSSEASPKTAATEWLNTHFQQAITLEDSELFRACLLKISDDNWYYVGMAHHISMDGWGFANWAERLGTYYQSTDVEEKAKPWAQVIEKEKAYIAGTRYEKDKAYWQAQLADFPEPILSPYYFQEMRFQSQQFQGQVSQESRAETKNLAIPSHREILPISAKRHAELAEKGKALGVPVAQLYQALVTLYFSRFYGVDELVLGSPVHNRSDKADKSTLGAFISVIPVRLQTEKSQTLQSLCDQIKTRMRQNFKHQRFPSGAMRRELQEANHNNERRSLFEIGFNYLKLDSDLDIDGQSANLVYLSHNHEQTPIMMTIWEYGEGQGVELQMDHNLAYFSEGDARRIGQRFEGLLNQVLNDEIHTLGDVNLISAEEKAALWQMSHGPQLAYEESTLAHHWIEQQALIQPQSTALVCVTSGQSYNFETLNQRANQLARFLLDKGCTQGDFIGVHCGRSANMVVSLLATLKIGAAFVSLDPEYPASRINYIVENSGIQIVLAETGTVRPLGQANVIDLDEDKNQQDLKYRDSDNLDLLSNPNNIAYGIYTSGSTGKPKGVMIRHRNLLAMLHWARATYSDKQLNSVLASTSLNFDLSMFELFVPLCFGFQCVLVKNALALIELQTETESQQKLDQKTTKNEGSFNLSFDVSLINTVPSAAKALLQHNAIPASVNTVNLAGEPLPAQVVNGLLQDAGVEAVYNLYGPSEDTTYSTCATYTQPIRSVPHIGKVIANSQAWVLSPDQALLPVGAVGELYLSGDGVAAGYLNRDDLTKERFVELDLADGPFYRTGDLVRYQNDGTLAFIGRIDDQVKLRGFRIELGEIEHALVSQPSVQEAIVMVVDDVLVAYVVTHTASESVSTVDAASTSGMDADNASFDETAVKSAISQSLPHYMVPTHFVALAKLPLTPNGKVDKKALPKPSLNNKGESSGSDNGLVAAKNAPENTLEQQVRRLVAAALGKDAEQISMNASFFELGGHSLLAVNLASNISKTFGVTFSIQEAFEAVSLRDLSHTLAEKQQQAQKHALPPLLPTPLPTLKSTESANTNEGQVLAPLSLTQQRLWFIEKVQGHSTNYNMPFALTLKGEVDPKNIEAALRHVILQHEILRTTYEEVNGQAQQCIHQDISGLFALTHHDKPYVKAQNPKTKSDNDKPFEATEALKQSLIGLAQTPFELSRELPIRAHWFSQNDRQENVLFINVHHIAFDGWSVDLFLQAFSQAYDAVTALTSVSTNTPNSAQTAEAQQAPQTLQYRDYAIWQNKVLKQGHYQSQLDYWQQQLAGAPLRHSLPIKSVAEPSRHDVGIVTKTLPKSLINQVQAFAKQHNLTLFMQLHGALALLLSRHSNTQDIVIGTPVANRGQLEIQSLMGFFVNTLALRASTHFDDVEAYFDHIRSINLQGQDNQSVPFDKVVEACNVERDLDSTPLFQILFTLNRFSQSQLQLGDLDVNRLVIDARQKKFDLEVEIVLGEDDAQIQWIYDPQLFDESWIETLTQHYQNILEYWSAFSASTLGKLRDVPLLNQDEQAQLLSHLSGCKQTVNYDKNATLPGLFEAQVQQQPNVIALRTAQRELSFSALNQMANQLAHKLTQQGVKAGDNVGVSCYRNEGMVAALLAILKLGASYIPLDPAYPASRRAHIAADSQMQVVITHQDYQQDIEQNLKVAHCIVLDDVLSVNTSNEDLAASAHQAVENPSADIASTSMAYVIYTSGSTGLPKGVAISHQNAVAMLAWANQTYAQTELTRVLASTSLSFDLSVFELFLPLCFGHQCVLVENALTLIEAKTTQDAFDVTLINTVPSAMKALVEANAVPKSVKVVNLAGEPLKTELVNDILALGVKRVCNLYGPSEDTTYSTYASFDAPIQHIPEIGRVIANSQAYVLNEQGALLPFGVPGELYLGGDGVALGYLNQPTLTAEKFIEKSAILGSASTEGETSVQSSNQRLYRTGDLVKFLDDQGTLAFLGRIDDQVKVRGFRIELGEVEQVIKQHSAVDQVCVIAVGEGQERHLAAFVVPRNDVEKNTETNHHDSANATHANPVKNDSKTPVTTDLAETLRDFLSDELPDYMVPSFINVLESLPLTPNGKIDKKALSQLELNLSASDAVVMPSTEMEVKLHGIWADLLQRQPDSFGITDNFFSLGGHSLLSVRLCAQVEKQLQRNLSVKAVFNHPNIQQMSAFLSAQKASDLQPTATALGAESELISDDNRVSKRIPATERSSEYFPLSFAQQRLWFLNQLESASSEYNMPASLTVSGELDIEQANRALQQVVERHELLRTRFVEVEGKPYLTLSHELDNALESALENQQTRQLNDQNAPILRVQYHDLSDLPQAIAQESLDALVQQNAQMQFDLLHDALLRVAYVKLAKTQGTLLFNMHHIISDGWSLGVLMREFLNAYQGLELPELSVQYIDYARWQQAQFHGEYLDSQLGYWEALMADAPSSHSLPLDRPRGAAGLSGKTGQGGLHTQTLPSALVQGVSQQLNAQQSTLFMFMQAALALHVGRISHEHDVVMGAPVAGREQHQVEPLIGLFLNTQLFRTEFSDNPNWLTLLSRTKTQHLASNEHNHVPFESIVERLNPVRDMHQSPLFQILINYNNTEQVEMRTERDGKVCRFESQKAQAQPNKYDITLYIEGDLQSGVELVWSYNADLFDACTIAFYANEFNHLISQLVQAPEKPILTHSWHSAPDWQSVAPTPNTAKEPAQRPINQAAKHLPEENLPEQGSNLKQRAEPQFFHWIEAQADTQPEAPALTFNGTTLTYAQLLIRVNQLANALTAQGIEAGHRVAILTQRSEQRVIAILATLKLGACYVPLSQELPPARVAYMLSAANADALLTDTASFADLNPNSAHMPKRVVVLDDPAVAQQIANQATRFKVTKIAPNSEAHIIYTSGSTGLPKGVAGTFGATANRIAWMLNAYPYRTTSGANTQENVAHITSMAFIRGVWELLVPLCGGAHLHLCDREVVKDTAKLWQWMQSNAIHRMVTAPSLMKALCDLAKDDATMPLDYWFVSGEPLLQAHADAVLAAFPSVRLFNLYGSTEVMSDVLVKEVRAKEVNVKKALAKEASVPVSINEKGHRETHSLEQHQLETENSSHWVSVGRPIDNLNVFILGDDGAPLPSNVIGEIAVCGAGLSNGYISTAHLNTRAEAQANSSQASANQASTNHVNPNHNPNETAFLHTPVGRVYRTGDLGFIRDNGDIECLGRADDQVKIRGYRVEPGEITTLLNQQDEVRTCYVRATKLGKGRGSNQHSDDYTLVAYVVPHTANGISNTGGENVVRAEASSQNFSETKMTETSMAETSISETASKHLLPILKQRVASALPAYMHPAFYVFLEDLPLRPNGKVDRQALPQPDLASMQQENVPPANALETEIAAIWAALLQVPQEDIGVTTSFFDLGGHSLLATRLMKKLEETYQLTLSYKEFFENNAIRYLAQRVEQARRMQDVLTQSNNNNNKKNNKLVL